MKLRQRVVVALVIGVVSGVLCCLYQSRLGWSAGGDFGSELRSAPVLLAGQNPYVVLKDEWPLFYPLPTLLLMLPFAALPLDVAAGVFFGLTSGLLAFRLGRDGPWRLLLFLAFPFWGALQVAQWSPLICLAYLYPALLPVSLLKPSTGLPIALTGGWTRRQIALLVAVTLLSLAILPTWPLDLLQLLGKHPDITPASTLAGGLCALVAAVGWRRVLSDRMGLVFLMLLLIPQTLFYDPLVLYLAAQSRRQALLLAVSSWASYIGWLAVHTLPLSDSWVVGWLYLPVLIVLLDPQRAREHPGPLWGWLAKLTARAPRSRRLGSQS